MKRRVFSTLMVLVMVFVMTIGSTALTWAGTGSVALESSIRKALESYEAKNETSDGDLMFFVYDLLPNDMKDAEIEIYRVKFEAATETSAGSISFHVPRAGDDGAGGDVRHHFGVFQSTSPERGTTCAALSTVSRSIDCNPRPPSGGRP